MANSWHYTVNGRQHGPVTWEELWRLAQQDQVRPTDLVWQEGMANWVKAKTIPSLISGPKARTRTDEDEVEDRPRRNDDRPRRSRDDYDDIEDRGQSRRRSNPRGMSTGLKVGLILGCLALIFLIGGGILIWALQTRETVVGQGLLVPGPGGTLTRTGNITNRDPLDRELRSPCHVYEVNMVANRTYTIDLESNQFDAYLRLEDHNRVHLAANDDAGPGTLNSRIVFSPMNTQVFRVIATSLDRRPGNYTLRIREGIFPLNNNFNKDKKF